MRTTLLAILGLAACQTPYGQQGVMGGYTDHPIAPGVYVIEARGNAYTSSGTIMSYVYRRAAELCPHGFDVVDSASGVRTNYTVQRGIGRNQATVTPMHRANSSIMVQCRTREAAPPVAAQPIALSATTIIDVPGDVWHCYAGGVAQRYGLCLATEQECIDTRALVAAQTSTPPGDCAAQARVVCFSAKVKLTGRMASTCTPDFGTCEALAESFRGDPDWGEVSICQGVR